MKDFLQGEREMLTARGSTSAKGVWRWGRALFFYFAMRVQGVASCGARA
jgi:hypothetical protein